MRWKYRTIFGNTDGTSQYLLRHNGVRWIKVTTLVLWTPPMARVVVFSLAACSNRTHLVYNMLPQKCLKNILVSTNDLNYIFTTQPRSDRGLWARERHCIRWMHDIKGGVNKCSVKLSNFRPFKNIVGSFKLPRGQVVSCQVHLMTSRSPVDYPDVFTGSLKRLQRILNSICTQ